MRSLTLLVALLSFANLSTAATFAERVAFAKKIEAQKEASDYFFGTFFPTFGSSIGGIMKMCLARDGASQEKFTLVANVSLQGELVAVDFEPKSNNTGACFAKEFSSLKAPTPPLCDCGLLPLVIDMAVKP